MTSNANDWPPREKGQGNPPPQGSEKKISRKLSDLALIFLLKSEMPDRYRNRKPKQ